jgi:hypothetical protein
LFKPIKLLLALLLLAHPASATWALVSSTTSTSNTGTSCNLTITSTGAGHLIVVIPTSTSTSQLSISSISGGGTYTICNSGCQDFDSTLGGGVDGIAYVLSSTSGVTSITCTLSGSASATYEIEYEFSYTASSIALDTDGTRTDTSGNGTFAGVTLSPTGSNDVLLQACYPTNTATAITTYTGTFPGGIGFGRLLNSTSGTAPTWTVSSGGRAAMAAIAFTETSTPTTVNAGAQVYL